MSTNLFGDDNLFDDSPDDENDEYEVSADPEPARVSAPSHSPLSAPIQSHSASRQGRRLRVRPMTAKMAQNHPDVVSIVLTRHDGRQLVFIRK